MALYFLKEILILVYLILMLVESWNVHQKPFRYFYGTQFMFFVTVFVLAFLASIERFTIFLKCKMNAVNINTTAWTYTRCMACSDNSVQNQKCKGEYKTGAEQTGTSKKIEEHV